MKLEQAAREVVRQHSMECLSDKTVDALREALAKQATVSDGLCGGCAKKAADGWALYCVECWEQAEQEPDAIDGLARACNLAGVDYQTFLRIKAYLPVTVPVRTKDLTDTEIATLVQRHTIDGKIMPFALCEAVIAADREKNK